MSFKPFTSEEIEERFRHHPPRDQRQTDKYVHLRKKYAELAKEVCRQTPTSPEQSRALNALEESLFLANAAIARHDKGEEPPELK